MHICMYVCTCMWHQKRCALYMSWPKRKINFEKIHTKKMRNRFEPKHKKKQRRNKKNKKHFGPTNVRIHTRKKEKYCSTGCKSEHSTHIHMHAHTFTVSCAHQLCAQISKVQISIIDNQGLHTLL